MFTLFIVLHVIFCIFLILVILLQTGKGAGIGAAFGGGSQTVFGPRGAGSFIGKVTGVVAGLFMLTSIVLAFLSTSRSDKVSKAVEALQHVPASEVESVSLAEKKDKDTGEAVKDSTAAPVKETNASTDPAGADVEEEKAAPEAGDKKPSADAAKSADKKIVPSFKESKIPDLAAGSEKKPKAAKPVGLKNEKKAGKSEKEKPASAVKPKAEKPAAAAEAKKPAPAPEAKAAEKPAAAAEAKKPAPAPEAKAAEKPASAPAAPAE